MRLIRSLVSLALLLAFVIFGATVKLGDHTLFQHVKRIWDSDETQELVEGAKDKGAPVFDRVKRGVEAGVKEANTDETGDPSAEKRESIAKGESKDAKTGD